MRSSITSKSSPPGSASAPSADYCPSTDATRGVLLPEIWCFGTVPGARTAEISKKLWTRRHHQSQQRLWMTMCANCAQFDDERPVRPQPQPIPNRCTQTTQSVPVSCTTPPASPAAQTPCCPQHAQALILLLKSLHSLFFRKGRWGRAVPHLAIQARNPRVSLHPISFQECLRRSTVVVRRPGSAVGVITGTGVRRRGFPRGEPLK